MKALLVELSKQSTMSSWDMFYAVYSEVEMNPVPEVKLILVRTSFARMPGRETFGLPQGLAMITYGSAKFGS